MTFSKEFAQNLKLNREKSDIRKRLGSALARDMGMGV
jgi:hypothetical protein